MKGEERNEVKTDGRREGNGQKGRQIVPVLISITPAITRRL